MPTRFSRSLLAAAVVSCALPLTSARADAPFGFVTTRIDPTLLAGPTVFARNLLTTFGDPADYRTTRGTGFDGVGALFITKPNGSFICSGSLLSSRWDVLTAAHCLTDDTGRITATSVQSIFLPRSGGSIAVGSTRLIVPPSYDGRTISNNDIAIVRLDRPVTDAGVETYQLWSDPRGVPLLANFVGFGASGTGATGITLPAGTRRSGFNVFDVLLGAGVLLSDFDNGLPQNDASCLIFAVCQPGLGPFEVSLAGGDSGGPAFVNFGGQRFIAGVASFGLSLGSPPDVDDVLNSSFGEFSGHTFTGIHAEWVRANMVPEPSSFALIGLGVASLSLVVRRQRARSRVPVVHGD